MIPVSTDRVISNRRVRFVLLAIQDVMGRNGLNATLKLAGLQRYINSLPPANRAGDLRASEYAALIQAIETLLGSGARGQLNRIGHAAFHHLVAADQTRWNVIAFLNRFLPARDGLRRSLAQLARHLAEPDGQVGVFSDDRQLLFVDDSSDATHGRRRASEICWLTAGQIQECLRWAAGANYNVTEVACKAKGDSGCRFEIGAKLE